MIYWRILTRSPNLTNYYKTTMRNMASDHKLQKMNENRPSCSTIKEVAVEETFPKAEFDGSTSDFDKIVKANCFVDKTLLMRTIFAKTTHSMILITAPRRFAKSTNMDMVKKFVEIQVDENGVVIDREKSPNRQIFEDNNLLIFQDKEFFDQHFATYPVIHADFKGIRGDNFNEVLESFRELLQKTFEKYEYLLKSDKLISGEKSRFNRYFESELYRNLTKTDVQVGLEFLSKCLYKHFDKKKVFVLIDEYDAPINNTMFKESMVEYVNELLCAIFSSTLKGNEYVERALLTGISFFATVGLSGANNVEKYMFLGDHLFVPYYGLTEDEVTKLLTKFKIDDGTKEKVKLYYNGYLSLNGTKLFSIWSILHFLQKRKFKEYWEDSGVMTNLEEAMNIPVVRCCIETLCLGMSLEIEIFETIEIDHIRQLQKICLQKTDLETYELLKPGIYLSFLLQQGYLTLAKQVSHKLWAVRIPNATILERFQDKLLDHYGPSINLCIKNCAVSFEKISLSSENEIFADFITKFNEVIDQLKNKFIEKNEDTYHCIMFFILCKTKFSLITEFTIPRARLDLILCADDLGIIIELKYKKSSTEALKQIIENKYLNAFNRNPRFENVTKYLYIGLNVSENNVADISVLVNSADVSKAIYF